MPSREYVMLVIESAYGVPKATPVLGTDKFYARLDDGNSFTMQMEPTFNPIMYGGGLAIPALQVSDQKVCRGRFQTKLYAGSYCATLLKWAMTTVNSGRTTPWATTDASFLMPVGDLASMSFYHAIQNNDSTYDLRRYGGVKALNCQITCSRQSPVAMATFDIQGIRDDLNAAGSVAYPDATEF